jgi:hypothetical protein
MYIVTHKSVIPCICTSGCGGKEGLWNRATEDRGLQFGRIGLAGSDLASRNDYCISALPTLWEKARNPTTSYPGLNCFSLPQQLVAHSGVV